MRVKSIKISEESIRIRHVHTPSSRPVHDDQDATQGNAGTEQVIAVWCGLIDLPAPQQLQHDEHTTIGGIDAAERCGLEGWHDPLEKENQSPEYTEPDALALTKPEPHQISTANLTQTGKQKVQQRFGN